MAWLDRYPALPADHDDLEARAAVHEFGKRMPRHAAEAQAHQDYLRDKAMDSAAHHLVGVKAAHAAGHSELAAQHHEAYTKAMKQAGHDPTQPPPQEVLTRASKVRIHSYTPHDADELFEGGEEEKKIAEPEDDGKAHLHTLLERVRALKAGLTAQAPTAAPPRPATAGSAKP